MNWKTCTLLQRDQRIAPRLAVLNRSMWEPGQTISIGFLDGSPHQQGMVVKYAVEWLEYTNLQFEFFHAAKSVLECEVRIDFRRNAGSWSYLGKQALAQTNPTQPTMNFGWLHEGTPDEEFRRVVQHEFGHMLGAIHEHQSPAAGIKWDKPVVYQYYWQTQRWSKEQVNENIFMRYDEDISNTEFDRESIMLYPIPQNFTLDDYEVGWNTGLSQTDKEFISEMYPRGENG